jgi:hypothetical protein
MPKILAIDPGSKLSGYVVWNTESKKIEAAKHCDNLVLLKLCREYDKHEIVAIEQIRGYGIVAGDDTFDTCEWIGRFHEAHANPNFYGATFLIPRKEIKRHLCNNTTTNDKYVRMALIDRYGDVGTKRQPGPLAGISGHLWAALAVAVTCADTKL